jgi:hypothetical protein
MGPAGPPGLDGDPGEVFEPVMGWPAAVPFDLVSTAKPGLAPTLNGSAGTYLDGTGAFSTPVAAPGDTSKVIAAGTSTILANTCRYIVGHFEIVSGAHLVIEATGSLEVR